MIEQTKESLENNVPGNSYSFTQPIELRVQELVAGVRSDVGLSLYGDDLEVLKLKGDELVRALNQVEGAADVQAQQIAGLSYLRVIVRRGDLATWRDPESIRETFWTRSALSAACPSGRSSKVNDVFFRIKLQGFLTNASGRDHDVTKIMGSPSRHLAAAP